nr:hypothetical protein [uncultured Deefgea sp.]
MQADFSRDVGQKHGLERGVEGSKATHKTIKNFYTNIKQTEKFLWDAISTQRNSEEAKTAKIEQLEHDLKASRKSEDGLINDVVALRKQVESLKKGLDLASRDIKFTREIMTALPNVKPTAIPRLARDWAENLPSHLAKQEANKHLNRESIKDACKDR